MDIGTSDVQEFRDNLQCKQWVLQFLSPPVSVSLMRQGNCIIIWNCLIFCELFLHFSEWIKRCWLSQAQTAELAQDWMSLPRTCKVGLVYTHLLKCLPQQCRYCALSWNQPIACYLSKLVNKSIEVGLERKQYQPPGTDTDGNQVWKLGTMWMFYSFLSNK